MGAGGGERRRQRGLQWEGSRPSRSTAEPPPTPALTPSCLVCVAEDLCGARKGTGMGSRMRKGEGRGDDKHGSRGGTVGMRGRKGVRQGEGRDGGVPGGR